MGFSAPHGNHFLFLMFLQWCHGLLLNLFSQSKCFITGFVWCANLLTIPRLSAPPIGMAKLYQQKLSWTRLQISAKVCHVLFFFLSYQHCPLLSLLRFNMHERKLPRKIYSTYTFLKFSKNCSMQGVTSVIKKKSSRHVVSDHFRKQTVRLFKAASQLVLF